MKKVFVFILLFGIIAGASGQAKEFPKNEEFSYSGYYNWGFIWMKAGWVTFKVSESEKYPEAMKLEAIGSSMPSWDWIFRLRDTLTSHCHPRTFLPYEFSRKAHEGSYDKTFHYVWDYDSSRIFADIHRVHRYKKRDTIALQPDTYDMLSVAWKARGLDFDNYAPQDTIPIRILLDEKIYGLYVRFLGIDRVKIGESERESYVFSPLLIKGDVFTGGEGMKIWVSRDEERIPLMVEAKILVGSVKGILDVKNE